MTAALLDRSRRVLAAIVGVALLAALAVTVLVGDDDRTVTAYFPRTVGVYEGSDVRIMGIRVGRVESVEPEAMRVRVELTYDADYRLPTDVRALIVAPSVIADRFVQLAPAHDGGAVLADGAVIEDDRTGVPVELDETFDSALRLTEALGPEGANHRGAVDRLLSVAAEVLDGTGSDVNATLRDVSRLSGTLAASRDDITGAVERLAGFTGELARYDGDVAAFNEQLASVTEILADDREDLSALLESLASALGQVETFVRDNRDLLGRNVDALVDVTGALREQRESLRQILEIAPLAFSNLNNAYDAPSQAVRTRANFAEVVRGLDIVLCNAVKQQVGDDAQPLCDLVSEVVDQLPILQQPLPSGGLP